MFESLIRFLLDPFNVLWLLLLATAGVWFLKKKRFFKWLAVFTAGWFLIVSTPLVPVAIINSLEDRYEPLYIEELEDINLEFHIIVLGAGHGFDDRLPPNSLLSQNALGRLNEGIRLQQQLPNSKLVLSGSTSTPGRTTQAEMLQKTALLLGIEEGNTIVQKEPMNTWQEAEFYASDYGNTHSVILVTSATHMPRAMMSFNKFGLEPTPSPTNYRLLGSWKQKRFGLPSRHSMDLFNVGMSSYAAMLYYQFFK